MGSPRQARVARRAGVRGTQGVGGMEAQMVVGLEAPGVGRMEAPEAGEMAAWVVAGWAVTVGVPSRQLHVCDQQFGVTCRTWSATADGPSGQQRSAGTPEGSGWVGGWVGCVDGMRVIGPWPRPGRRSKTPGECGGIGRAGAGTFSGAGMRRCRHI